MTQTSECKLNLKKALEEAGIDLERCSFEELKQAFIQHYQEEYFFRTPHEKQKLFYSAGKTAKERLFLAGNRTGKTFCAALEMTMHLTGNYPTWWEGYRYERPIDAWAASTSAQATRDILQHQNYIGDGMDSIGLIPTPLILKVDRAHGLANAIDTVYIRHASGGTSTLGFKSYEQGRDKFQGTRKHVIHLDEEPPRGVYLEALMRLMATDENHHGMMLLTMTPKLGLTEMVQYFTENASPELTQNGRFYIQAQWNDNPYLREEEKADLRAKLKPHELDAVEKGIPTLGMGLVYPVSESSLVCDPFEIPDHWARVFGLDFGWNPSPTAVLFAAHDRDSDVVYLYGEYAATELTPQHHAAHLLKLGATWIPGVYDPAGRISSLKDGANLVDLYREAGIRFLSKADNSKEEGLMRCLQRMQNGQLKIFSNLSKTLTEFRMYARDDYGIPKKGNDHLMDCMRYVIMSGLPVARTKANSHHAYNISSVGPHSWMKL